MNVDGTTLVEKIVHAVLYEGYILYPYRASAVKNRQRFNFGGLYPPAYSHAQSGSDACEMQTECLVLGDRDTMLDVRVRFLHLLARQVGRFAMPIAEWTEPSNVGCEFVESLEVDGQLYQTWQEAAEREITLPAISLGEITAAPFCREFSFPASCDLQGLPNAAGQIVAMITRQHKAVAGSVEITAEAVDESLYRVRIKIANHTPVDDQVAADREQALGHTLASTHTILGVREGQFVSLLDPPPEHRQAAADCQNEGTWPVLVGQPGERDTLLSSPIILYDYPEIAPESSGDLFDGLEIDEILMLRIMTLTDEEKRQMRSVDEHARAILERTERLPQQDLMKMHGALRGLRPSAKVES